MTGTPRTGWLTVGLLFLAQVLNYFDKTVLGIAATAIMTDLGLTSRDYGLVASAFFSLYAATGLAVAFIAAPRVGPRIIMAALLLVWSIAQLPIVFAASFTTLISCRILLGMGEGAGTPTAVNACHEWFSPRERAIPTTLVLFGSQAGSLLAAPALSYLIAGYGWRSAFLACGLGGFALFLLWILLSRDGPQAISAPDAAPVSGAAAASSVRQRDLWCDGTVIGNVIAGFGAYWIVGFFVSWLPVLLHQRLALDTVAAGWALCAGYALQAAILLATAFIVQASMRRGARSRIALGWTIGGGLIGSSAAFLIAAIVSDPRLSVVLVMLACALPLSTFTLGSTMIGEICPAEHRNRLITVILSLVTVAAIPAPIVTGHLAGDGSAAGWSHAFISLAAVALVSGLLSFAMLHPERSIARLRGAQPTPR
jgi:MFS family permease